MKVFLTPYALAGWLWLWSSAVCAQALGAAPLLIVESSPADEPAALRLRELMGQPSELWRLRNAGDLSEAHGVLMQRGAERALVLDSAARRVHVIGRDGQVRTRVIEGEPTAYLVAFVASELLTLRAVPAQASPPPPARTSRLARFDAQLALDLARAYTSAWLLRPKLGVLFWLRAGQTTRALPLFGLAVAGPSQTQRAFAPDARLSVVRWDTALRAGVALPWDRLRLLLFARGVAAFQRARFSGVFGIEQRTVSLGLGAGAALEIGLTRWLGVSLSADLDALLRRSLFTLHGERALREPWLVFSGSLGLVFSTPWP